MEKSSIVERNKQVEYKIINKKGKWINLKM